LGCLALLCGAVAVTAQLRAAVGLRLHAESRAIEVLHENRTVLTYWFATNQFKPYVRDLISLDGVDLLRDAPADHLHHHGFMYGIKVNDLNFWEETPTSGRQIPQHELTRDIRRDPAGRPQARFSQTIHWVAPDHAALPDTAPAALLVEQRSLTTTIDSASERIHIEWQSDFVAGPGSPRITLSGSNYHGLGIRFRADFDGVADRFNSENLPYPDDGQQGVLPVRWMAVSHTTAGRPYTLMLFSHPSNPGSTRFFSMQKPFTYLSVTQGLDETPLNYRSGDRWSLKYLLVVSPRRMTPEQLDRQYELFSSD
jgi:hypothetical protein